MYIGHSLSRSNEIRDILDRNKISYTHKARNREGGFLAGGRGTARTAFGSAGMNKDYLYEYEIKVSSEDYEKAEYLIQKAEMEK